MAVRVRTHKDKDIFFLIRLLKYLIITTIVIGGALFYCEITPDSPNTLVIFIVSVLFASIGAFIGDTVRRYCKPDIVYAKEDIWTIFKTKLYWKYGPQWTGWSIGLITAIWLFFNV